MSNAIKFTDQGKVVVTADAETRGESDLILHIAVRDTGIGIAQDKQETVFELFSQADSTTTRRYGGTGLGLAIARQLVTLMGGRIWLESEEGEGSTFHFTASLKVQAVSQHAHDGSTQPHTQVKRGPDLQKRLKVLLVEDNLLNQEVATGLLERRGHEVALAENGREALEVLERQQFDLVLMDVQMPEMDGIQATTAIRDAERQTGGHIPIVGLTAYAMKGDSERFLAAGMDAYVPKPIRPAELFAAIAEITGAGTASVGKGDSTVREAALSRVDGDVKILGRLVKLFREDYPKVLADMRDAISGNEPDALRLAAHSLKSQVGTLGLHEAFELADKLQTIGLEGDLSAAEEIYEALHDEIELRTPELMELAAEGDA